MSKRLIALAVSTALLCAICVTPAAAGAGEEEQARLAAKVRSAVAELGTGPDARIEVKLLDKTKLKGYVSEANSESFVVVDDKTGTSTQLSYSQVQRASGRNRVSGDKILAVAIVGFLVVANLIGYARCGSNC